MRATVLNFLRLCSLYVVAQTTSASQFSFATRLPVSSRRSKQFPGIDTTKRLTNEELSPLLRLRGGENFSSIVDYVGQSNARCWISLFLAVCMDATSTALLKVGRDKSSIITILAAYGGFFFSLSGFAMSLGKIDVSTAYAVWGALGTAIVSIMGILFFNETFDIRKTVCLGMIILGVAGLNLSE